LISVLMQLAVDKGWRADNPAAGAKGIRSRSQGFATWSENNIAQFEAHHPVGSKARLAFDLLLQTGQRRGDVVTIGRQHVQNGLLTIRQSKTGELVTIPVNQKLQASLDAAPRDHLTFLVTQHGRPYSPAGFTNTFRKWTAEAGLPVGLSPHGLRKAMCRRIAEGGGTPHEIMAVSGHKTLSEVTRYTVAANKKQLGERAMDLIERRTRNGKPNE
ncbi:MAG TPA: tyrosine-type recombinase/integrase, partial [Methyloceanibacter sp.]